MLLWHNIWQMPKKCHTTRAEKPVSVYRKSIKVGDQLTITDIIQIASEVYNSDRQLSIIQNLSATTTAATAVQNPNIHEVHMMQAKHSRKEPSMEDRSQSMCKSCYCCGTKPSYLKKKCPTRDAECYKYKKKGHSKGACKLKKEEKEVGRPKDMKRKQKPTKFHELRAQATVGT